MVDVAAGLILAKPHHSSNQLLPVLCGAGLHNMAHPLLLNPIKVPNFTGATVQKLTQTMDMQWNFHLPYILTASGYIERANGFIKTKLHHFSDTPLKKSIEIML
jgi:hypothetical protein